MVGGSHQFVRVQGTWSHLGDQGEPRAQVKQPDPGDVDAVNEDVASGGLHHALERHHEGALAAAGAPCHAHLLLPYNK